LTSCFPLLSPPRPHRARQTLWGGRANRRSDRAHAHAVPRVYFNKPRVSPPPTASYTRAHAVRAAFSDISVYRPADEVNRNIMIIINYRRTGRTCKCGFTNVEYRMIMLRRRRVLSVIRELIVARFPNWSDRQLARQKNNKNKKTSTRFPPTRTREERFWVDFFLLSENDSTWTNRPKTTSDRVFISRRRRQYIIPRCITILFHFPTSFWCSATVTVLYQSPFDKYPYIIIIIIGTGNSINIMTAGV